MKPRTSSCAVVILQFTQGERRHGACRVQAKKRSRPYGTEFGEMIDFMVNEYLACNAKTTMVKARANRLADVSGSLHA